MDRHSTSSCSTSNHSHQKNRQYSHDFRFWEGAVGGGWASFITKACRNSNHWPFTSHPYGAIRRVSTGLLLRVGRRGLELAYGGYHGAKKNASRNVCNVTIIAGIIYGNTPGGTRITKNKTCEKTKARNGREWTTVSCPRRNVKG